LVGLLSTRRVAVEVVRGILERAEQVGHLLVAQEEHNQLVLLLQRIPLAVEVDVREIERLLVVLVGQASSMSGTRYDRSILRST
jgi:hypothetical protein